MAVRTQKVRTREPDRSQGWLFLQRPDELVGAEHPARLVVAGLERLDLSGFLEKAKAVEGHPGRPVTRPKLLLASWRWRSPTRAPMLAAWGR